MKYLSAAARNATKVANVSHIAYSMRIHFCLPNNGHWNERCLHQRQEIHSLHIHNMNWYFWLVCFFFVFRLFPETRCLISKAFLYGLSGATVSFPFQSTSIYKYISLRIITFTAEQREKKWLKSKDVKQRNVAN